MQILLADRCHCEAREQARCRWDANSRRPSKTFQTTCGTLADVGKTTRIRSFDQSHSSRASIRRTVWAAGLLCTDARLPAKIRAASLKPDAHRQGLLRRSAAVRGVQNRVRAGWMCAISTVGRVRPVVPQTRMSRLARDHPRRSAEVAVELVDWTNRELSGLTELLFFPRRAILANDLPPTS